MDFIAESLHQYCINNSSPEPAILRELRKQTHLKIPQPRMLSGPLQGRFLSLLASIIGAKRILEVGTYTGYAAICMAEALPADGKLITIEKNDELQWLSSQFFKQAGFEHKILQYVGNAIEIIPTLEPYFDLVFIDADKENYIKYYHQCKKLVRKGGLLICDNTLWSGKVLQPANIKDKDTQVLQELNALVAADKEVKTVLLPLRDGLLMAQKN
ncbi:MAG: O-methyltransferase [Luteibaculaceae bacterium]